METLRRMEDRILDYFPIALTNCPWREIFCEEFLDDWLCFYRDLQESLGSLDDHSTFINRIEKARQYYLKAQLATVYVSRYNCCEAAAMEQVIALVLETHATYSLNTPENIENGFRIPVSSIQIIPTEQEWIDVTPTDLQELSMTARSYIAEKMEGSVANMIVHKEGVKHQYRSQFLETARGNYTTQTFEDLFGEKDYIDGAIRIGFVSTDNIVAYLRAQGVTLNPNANRVIAISKLLELSTEETRVYFFLRPHTMEFIHSHRRSEAAMDILKSLDERWDQDPWNSLQELVHRQGEVRIRLALKYFTNAGLIELLWMYKIFGFGEKLSHMKTREKRVRVLSKEAQRNLISEWRLNSPEWLYKIMINVRALDRLMTRKPLTHIVELLEEVTDPLLRCKITEAAFADPGSFALALQISSDLEEFLTQLDLAVPKLGVSSIFSKFLNCLKNGSAQFSR